MNVEELKQACSQYFSRYYSEFEDYLYVVEDNKYKNIDFPDYFLFIKFEKYDAIAFKFIDKNTYLDTENVDLYDINKVYKLVYIRAIDDFEAALSSYLKKLFIQN